jgi:hypothetical protein
VSVPRTGHGSSPKSWQLSRCVDIHRSLTWKINIHSMDDGVTDSSHRGDSVPTFQLPQYSAKPSTFVFQTDHELRLNRGADVQYVDLNVVSVMSRSRALFITRQWCQEFILPEVYKRGRDRDFASFVLLKLG